MWELLVKMKISWRLNVVMDLKQHGLWSPGKLYSCNILAIMWFWIKMMEMFRHRSRLSTTGLFQWFHRWLNKRILSLIRKRPPPNPPYPEPTPIRSAYSRRVYPGKFSTQLLEPVSCVAIIDNYSLLSFMLHRHQDMRSPNNGDGRWHSSDRSWYPGYWVPRIMN